MTKEEILKVLNTSCESLMFKLTDEEIAYFFNNFDSVMDDLNAIKNFDLSKYEDYAFVDDYNQVQPMSRLRADEPVMVDNPHQYFKNAVAYEDGMVVVKNEK